MTTTLFNRHNKIKFFIRNANKNYTTLLPLISIAILAQSNFAHAQDYYPPAPQPYYDRSQPLEKNYDYDGRQEYQSQQPQNQAPQTNPNTSTYMTEPSNYTPSNYPDNIYDEQNYPSQAMPQSDYEGLPNADTPAFEMPKGVKGKRQIVALQVLMSRAGASSGVIDGMPGSNFDKAAAAASQMTGKFIDPNNETALEAALQATGGPAFTTYRISNEDVGQFYLASIPNDYALKAQLPSMAYTSVREMLAERFHIDERYLQEVNPNVNFNQPGIIINVPNLLLPKRKKIAFIVADKANKQLRGYDENRKLVVAYPSTIGSSDNPSPSGTVEVKRIAINPNYTYNPKVNFKQGDNDKILTIPPGPKGPVGTVWIALSKPTYGIHGTPDPSRIGKTSSHGCVRLTNWDAQELAKLIKPGVIVQFID